MSNFRPGYLEQGSPLGASRKQVMLIADNQQVDLSGVSYLELSSNNTTASNRTFILVQSTLVGHTVEIVFVSGSSTTAQLANSGTVKLAEAWTPIQYSSLTVFWNGSYWIEMCRTPLISAADIPLTDGHILVGDASDVAADVAMSGDVVIANTGVTAISAGVIVDADVNASAALAYSKLATMATGSALIGNAGVPTATALSGDVTVGATGVTAIGAGKVLKAMLATGVNPGYVAKYGGLFTTVGGDAAETIPAVGTIVGDVVQVTVNTLGTGSRTVLAAIADTDQILVTMSGDPSNNHILNWNVLRAAT